MNKGKFITRLLKRNASILAPLVLQQAKYQAGVAELVLEDCVQGKFIYDAFCQGQPSPSPSWAELVIILAFPATRPPDRPTTRPPDHPEKSKSA